MVVVLVDAVVVLVVSVDAPSEVAEGTTGGSSSMAVSVWPAQLLSAAASTAAAQAARTRAADPPDPLIVPACRVVRLALRTVARPGPGA